MSTKGERTRQRMLESTAELLRRRGYHGTGLSEILSEAGAPRGSLYFHFPGGKDELTAEALALSGEAWRALLLEAIGTAADPAEAIVRACERLAAELEASDFTHGCPIATVALETASTNEALRAVTAAHFQTWERVIAARLVETGMRPEAAAGVATLVLSSVEGAMLLSRAYRDVAPLRRVAIMLAACFRARRAEAAGPTATTTE